MGYRDWIQLITSLSSGGAWIATTFLTSQTSYTHYFKITLRCGARSPKLLYADGFGPLQLVEIRIAVCTKVGHWRRPNTDTRNSTYIDITWAAKALNNPTGSSMLTKYAQQHTSLVRNGCNRLRQPLGGRMRQSGRKKQDNCRVLTSSRTNLLCGASRVDKERNAPHLSGRCSRGNH